MLVQSRSYRVALRAHLRAGGDLRTVAREIRRTRRDTLSFLDGDFHYMTAASAARMETLFPANVRAWVRESPRFPVMSGDIPTHVIAPVITEAFSKRGREAVIAETGLAPRMLYGILIERSGGGVSFRVADLLVARLADPSWWYEGEQRRWFWTHSRVWGANRDTRTTALTRTQAPVAA